MPVAQALDCAAQIAQGLQAAHAKGIVHRDLKPANVKVTPQGQVKVLDFGLAKAVWRTDGEPDSPSSATAASGSQSGRVLGTPGYMSPEQTRGEPVDQRTDIWAFGCLFYELLAGRRAFAGDSLGDTVTAVLDREPDWHALPANTPAKIRAMLRQCLQKNANDRPTEIAETLRVIRQVEQGRGRWRAAVAVATAGIAIGGAVWALRPHHPLDRSAWVQLTSFTDSAAQPSLSPDGRMLVFVRGPATFVSPGQVYVKNLPDGEPIPLTHDSLRKMSPVFSPDGGRIAYTARDPAFHWDTWVVPVTGGEPALWQRNASGLIWTAPNRLLFSEIKEGLHMGIVSAVGNRSAPRDVYLPQNERGMAHRSYLSPDGKSVLLVEMDKDGLWAPCRVVPFDGSTQGRQVGPPGADCTSGAWSRDGNWVYLTSKAGGSYHIWRQRISGGLPEQVTSGPTEEEGVTMAPDGHSFITAVALQTGSIWLHDASGDRQISLEGNAVYSKFTRDGKKLCYLVLKSVAQPGTNRDPGEVWMTDLKTGRSTPLAPAFQAFSYDISPDGREIVMEVLDKDRKPRLWLAPMDRQSPPHQIPGVEGRECLFGSSGDIYFRRAEGASGYIYRVHSNGTGLRKALEKPVLILFYLSPDERWILAWAALDGGTGSSNQAIPLDGGPAVRVANGWTWSPTGRTIGVIGGTHSYLVDLPPGASIPPVPATGFFTEQAIAALPGARRIEERAVTPGPSPGVYAFYRFAVHRNLYRIPIP